MPRTRLNSLRGRIGAHSLHARYDSRALTRAARQKFLANFEAQVDPDGTLTLEERSRRADQARKAHFTRLAYLSATSRRRRARHADANNDQ